MSTLLDEETVVLDALDFEVPCEAGEHAAEVWVQCRFCRENAGALCRVHLQMKRGEAAWKLIFVARIACASCNTTATDFDELFEAVPL